jgi:hypothetical protein
MAVAEMKRAGLLLLMAVFAGPAYGQSGKGQSAKGQDAPSQNAPAPSVLTCGTLKAESSRMSSASQWTVTGPAGKTTETGVLRSGPRFECIDGAILVVEFTSTAGHSVFTAYFPDGTDIDYGRQQIERRGARYVLPVQAKARIAAPYRAAFDYHCRLSMPADPIQPAMRADCLF